MSLTPQQLTNLETLLSDLADERLCPENRLALEKLLQAEPEARDHYIRFLALCSDLHEFAATSLSAGPDEPEDETTTPATVESSWTRKLAIGQGVLNRWWPAFAAATTAVLLLAAAVVVATRCSSDSHISGPVVGRLENIAGAVQVARGETTGSAAEVGQQVHASQAVFTVGQEAQAAIRLTDGTAVLLAGDTRVVFAADDSSRIDVEMGNVTAEVQHRPADRPLVFCTPEARLEVLGTRLSVAREPRQTRVDVLEGNVRVTRLSDQRSVKLAGGQGAEVSPQADLRPASVQSVPDQWSLDFNEGLPHGWQTGQLVFDDLPEGSKAAVRAAGIQEHGRCRYQLRSHNAWSKGLFALHDDSWIHIRYRLDRPGTFLLYVVCRQHDFGQPIATVLTPGNLKQTEAGRWHTLTLPLSQFRRTKANDRVPLNGQLVAFLLAFDSPEQNPGLTIDRVWVARGTQAEPRSAAEMDWERPVSRP